MQTIGERPGTGAHPARNVKVTYDKPLVKKCLPIGTDDVLTDTAGHHRHPDRDMGCAAGLECDVPVRCADYAACLKIIKLPG